MTVDKKINYEVQGGVKNYLGKQKEVKAPLKWKSSPDSPETELAYITKAEKDLLVKQDLHGSLNGDVNRGPSGIMSLDGFGSFDSDDPSVDTGMSGAATSAAESGGGSGADARELAAESGRVRSDLGLAQLPPGVVDQNVQDYRNAFIAAGGGQRVNPGFFDSRDTVSPAELAAAKAYNPTAFRKTRGGGLGSFISGGGLLGNIVRGIGQKFGLGKRYNEPTYDMSEFSKLGLGGVDPTVNPNYYNDLDNELMLSTQATPSTLDLSKLETGDLNNLASLIKASQQPQGIRFNNPVGGVDQFAKEMEALEAARAGDIVSVNELGGTLQDFYTNRNPGTDANTRFEVIDDNINFNDGSVNEGILGIDVGQDDVAFENDLMAELATNSPALAQKRSLQKKQRLSELGGPEFTNEDQRKLNLLNQMEADPNKIYSQTV